MTRYWTRSDFETDGISRDYDMRVGEVIHAEWICHGTPVPDGADYAGHGHHSTLVKHIPSRKRNTDMKKRTRGPQPNNRTFYLDDEALAAMYAIPAGKRSAIVAKALIKAAQKYKAKAAANWVSVREAAKLAGMTPQALYVRAEKGTVRSAFTKKTGWMVDMTSIAPRYARTNGHA
jgi:hypothetical protein